VPTALPDLLATARYHQGRGQQIHNNCVARSPGLGELKSRNRAAIVLAR
jgi:hypothetical protein